MSIALLRHWLGTDAPSGTVPLFLNDGHGGDPAEWPEDLRIREFPR